MKSLAWVFRGCDPTLQAEIAACVHDEEFPNLRLAYLDFVAEDFLQGAVSDLPTTGSIN